MPSAALLSPEDWALYTTRLSLEKGEGRREVRTKSAQQSLAHFTFPSSCWCCLDPTEEEPHQVSG